MKRWIGLLVFAFASFARLGFASAADTVAANNIAFGPQSIGSTVAPMTTNLHTLVAGDTKSVMSYSKTGTGCTDFTIAPTMFPYTVDFTGVTVTATYAPTQTGALDCAVSLLDAGGDSLGSFHVTATGLNAHLTAVISPTTFANARVKDTALTAHTATATVTLTNTGDPGSAITVSNLAITGDFSITQTTPITVNQGTPVAFTVTFDPTVVGNRTGTLTITSTDLTNNPRVLNLSGTGTSAIINTTSPNLGTFLIGTAQDANVQVSNTGTGPLTVTSASFTTPASWITFKPQNGCSGAGPCTFSTPLTINSGTPSNVPFTCTIPNDITLVTMTQTATVTFVNDADSGTSTATVSCTAGKPTISIAMTTVMFGDVGVPMPGSASATIAIVNNGNMPLVIGTIALQTAQPQITLSSCVGCNGSSGIAPMGSATFNITFTPTTTTMTGISATVIVPSNDPTTPQVGINVSGRGYGGTIGVSPTTLAFGDVEVGQSSTTNGTVTISNTGNGPLMINSATISGTNAADFTLATAGNATINANSNTTYTYQCTPSAQGSRTATLTIASTTYPTGNKTVALTCNGTRGNLTAVATVDVGDTPIGSTHMATFSLGNNGNLAVTSIADAITPSQFTASGLPGTLAPNGSAPITIFFTPTVAGPVTGTYTITGNIGTHGQMQTLVVNLRGNGQSVDYGFNPATIDFMSFRYDQQKQVQFRIENNGAATIYVPIPTYMPDAGQSPSDYGFTYKKNGVGSNVNTSQQLNTGEFLLGTGTSAVLNRVGAVSGMLSFTTLAPGPIGTRTAIVTGTSTSADVTVPATLDFGTVDVDDATPHTMTFQIKNPAAGLLDLSSVTVAAGSSPAFTVTPPAGNLHLGMNETADITVTYHPTVDLPVNQFDTVTIVGHIGGILNGPIVTMTVAKGHPIDRHFAIKDVGSSATAFRNPGADAPIIPITIENTGEAALNVTMVTGDACDPTIWHIGPETSAAIAGNSTGDATMNKTATFHVTFSPTDAGQFDCVVDLMNDDNGMPIGMATVHGIGSLRDVSLATDHMDIGYTGVGIPLTAAQAIHLVNHDGTHAFHVTSIKVSNPEFVIGNIPDEIAAGADVPLDITFTPTEVNDDVTADATIFLDTDDQQTGMPLRITAHAVFVDAQGGGGCSTSGNGAGGGALLVAGAIAASLKKRRRAAIAAGALVGAASLVASADTERSLQISTFAPTPATTGTGFQVQSADVGPDGALSVGVVTSYATNLLVLAPSAPATHTDVHPLTQSLALDVGAAYAFLDRFEVGAHMPFYRQSGDAAAADSFMGFTTDPAGNARGNLTLDGKVRLVSAAGFVGSVGVVGLVPTASKNEFLTTKPEVRGLLLANYTLPVASNRISLAANVGGAVRAEQHYANVYQKSGAVWAAAASVRVIDSLWVTGELYGEVVPSGRGDESSPMKGTETLSPISALAGLNFKPDRRFTISVAAGKGINAQPGSPSFQGVLALAFVPGSAAIAPIHVPEPPKPDGDADGDGIPDSRDKCPNEPEDKDLFEDDDGCPDLDNDNDGIPDAQDKCPLDPEDKDGFQDDDGCPDLDNDGDGIPDAQDKCPNEPEDKDGFQDLDGCPDPDNDGDGVPDALDKCPSEPETINGINDDDGCPDKGASTIVLSPDRIETLDPIEFTGGKLARGTEIIMKQVGATLRAHVEIVRLRVTVHVQPSGDTEKDQQLSDKRAQAVRDWLVQWGIAPNRVEARGFGGSKPLVKPETRNAANINNRIELIILERK